MTAPSLRLQEAVLAGFGPYREATRFLFPDGPGVLLGPNESGKSTLLLGIAATLFGLPSSSDTSGFTAARFKSVPAVREFWGEVIWEAGGVRQRLHRVFDTHRVRWIEETKDGPREVFAGEHNPLAKAQARVAYPRLLRERLGLSSCELFLEAFCLGQVAHESDDLSADLQHLLSGSRTGRTGDVLQSLFDEVKDRTRATGDLGLLKPGNERAVNQRDPGRLERLEEELARTRETMEAGRTGLERINSMSEEREANEARRRELLASLQRRRGRVAILSRWTKLETIRREQEDELQRAVQQLRELDEVERARQAERTAGDGAGRGDSRTALLAAPPDLGARLEALAAAEDALASRRREEADVAARRIRLEEEQQALQSRIDGDLAPANKKRSLVEIRGELVTAIAERRARDTTAEALREEIARSETGLAAGTGWPEGLDPVLLRAHADAFLKLTSRLHAIAERKREIAGPLEGRRFLDEERMRSLRHKLEADEKLRGVRNRLRELETEAARRAEAEAKAEVLTERARAAEARREADLAAIRAREDATLRADPVSWWLSLLVSAGLGAGARFGLDADWAVAAGAAAVSLLILRGVNLLLRRSRRRRAQEARPVPPTAPASAAAPAGAAACAPDPLPELAALRDERSRLEQDLPPLREALGPFAEVTGPELARMEERWASLVRESDGLDAEQSGLLTELFGDDTTGTEWRAVSAERLSEQLRAVFALPGAPQPGTCGELADWLSSTDDLAWKRYRDAAAARRDAAEMLRTQREDLARHDAATEADRRVSDLEAELAPYTLETPLQDMERLSADVGRIRSDIADHAAQLSHLPAAGTVREGVREAEGAFEEARASWREAWPSGPEAPAEGVRAWAERIRGDVEEARTAATREQGLDETTARILRSAGVEGRADLERRHLGASAKLGATALELEKLESEDPFLAASREIRDPLERATRLHEVHESEARDLAAVSEEEARLARREVELRVELEKREEGSGTNLARLELELRGMEEERERLLAERDALVLAYGWVREAADRFRSTYREDIERRISDHFANLTGRPGRRVRVDDRFRLSPVESDGSELVPAQLSQGARDQLHLAMRLALADLLAGAVPLPLFFDDPFVHFDQERLEHLRQALARLSSSRQWILLTHRADLASWAEPVRAGAAR